MSPSDTPAKRPPEYRSGGRLRFRLLHGDDDLQPATEAQEAARMLFPEIPENLDALSALELRALAAAIRTAAEEAVANPEFSSEDRTKAIELLRLRKETILPLAAAKDRLEAALADATEDEEVAPETEAAATDDASDAGDEDPEDDEADEADEAADETNDEPETEAAVKPGKVRTQMGAASVPATTSTDFTPDVLYARDGVPGIAAGAKFDGWGGVSQALLDKARTLRTNTSEKFEVAYVPGNFDEDHILSENPKFNLRKFEPEIMAALCAPLEPQYTLSCWNSDRRPVRASMATYRPANGAMRGGVSVYPSPSLSDITGGYGIWDSDDDANPNAVKDACQTIECATPTDYRWYGVYRCITIKNMLAMTFPELVEAYLNRLAAATARLAEQQLLEAMGNEATAINAVQLGYNATVTVTSTVLNFLLHYQELERWDNPEMDAWLPRWVLYAMKMDMVRRRVTDGQPIRVPSDADVARLFSDAGVTPHFFMDTPSWATAIPQLAVNGVLGLPPRNLEILVAPRGKFAVMDRGELAIGVTGNNIYRDNTSNSRNEFTMFMENFEGVVSTTSCPAYILQIDNLCYSGQQIADVAITCEGLDDTNYGS